MLNLKERYKPGLDALSAAIDGARRRNLQPPPKLSLSQWAELNGRLSRETSAQTGRFRAFRYQIGMMDAVTDPSVTDITVMKSSRVGFTKVLDHIIGYYLHQDPSPILVVQPREEDAEDYSKTEIAPMLRDTPALKELAGDPKAKVSGGTILKKSFLNGSSLSLIGANSPGGFRRITARIVLFDEVDGYPAGGAGSEGDQLRLGKKRAETFWNRKIVAGSTPTIKGLSRIERKFAESDQRYFYVPCPQCKEKQVLEWGGKDTAHGIKWRKDDKGRGLPETAFYSCKANGCVIEEVDKPAMVAGGEWIATQPFKGHAGFHIWTAYSLFPNASWANLVEEWLEVKSNPLERQTFYNTTIGQPYEDRGDNPLAEDRLQARCEVFEADVSDAVAVLTAGIDVQDDRFEIEVVGWGKNEESWSVDHHVIEGDPELPEIWNQLDAYLKRVWRRGDGRGFAVAAACMDSGGHHTQKVYEFAKARLGRKIWAIKGESARGGERSPVWPSKRPTPRNKAAFRPIILGVNAAKDTIRARLHLEKPGAGYMHFPVDRDINYFAQLTAEHLVVKTERGKRFRVWQLSPGRANEALDCRVYAYAALCGLLHFGLRLNQKADALALTVGPVVMEPVVVDQPVIAGGVVKIAPVPNRMKSLISRLP